MCCRYGSMDWLFPRSQYVVTSILAGVRVYSEDSTRVGIDRRRRSKLIGMLEMRFRRIGLDDIDVGFFSMPVV